MDPWIKASLTVVVVGASLFIILFRDKDPEARGWAFWIVGFVLGYWLK